ncbi:MAG: tetratricopeptide repeat protein [Bacteroidales bacterium]|nr:MAG: tetratricopeptide repeat protein [Bacteroidales bacterium]
MKTNLISLVITLFVVSSCFANTKNSNKANLGAKQFKATSLLGDQQTDTLLNRIEQKVAMAFAKGTIGKTDNDLVALEESLLALNMKKGNSIIVYWYSYACYYHSILSMINKDLKKSENVLDEGLDMLDEVDPKTSEHYALLALMKSLSMRFAAGIRAPFISASVKSNAEKALELDSLNLRAYYVLGSNDFYTPEQYGGGKKAEGYFKKSIKMNNQSVKNQYLPSWGKNLAYELLIRLYIKREQFADAKKCFQEAIALYPNDYQINQLASKLVNH